MSPRILIAGGYGLVGGQAARHVRAAGHDVELILAGRNPESGEALARELEARLVRLDVADPAPGLAAAGHLDLVVGTLHDPGDHLVAAALGAGAGHIGIVRTAESVASTMLAIRDARPARPALILGHWQAGVLTTAARVAARDFDRVDRVELTALYDYADPIGPMTANDASDFGGAATLRRNGDWMRVDAPAEPRRVERAGGPAFDALPVGVLDIFSLATVTGARDVRFDLGMGESLGTLGGGPASHDLYIDLEGPVGTGSSARRRWRLSDPKGQAHLTALGVLFGIERALGLDGAPPLAAGLAMAEELADPNGMMTRLRAVGVQFDEETPG